MAHGDYKCCAICDDKQEYVGFNDSFKDDICPLCREKTGIATVKQLLEEINAPSKEDLPKWLEKIGFSECYYQNEVDELIAYKLTGAVPDKFKSSREWLTALFGEDSHAQ